MNISGPLILVVGFVSLSALFWTNKGHFVSIPSISAHREVDSTSFYQVELGRLLFYEKALSRDSTISCATCHKQQLAFTDGLPKSSGIFNQTVDRNSPTLTNVGNRPYLLLDGVNPNLEAQVRVPIQEHREFDFNIVLIAERLKENSSYVRLARLGFDMEIDHRVIARSIANFERTLISNNSPYDQYISGDKNALSKSQKRGKALFFDKLYCAQCHNGNDFTNDALTNNGLYKIYADSGRIRLTEREKDRAIFKVPTLRNIEVTAPYMHNGSFETLSKVIDHYQSGGENHIGKGFQIVPFKLSRKEKKDLINFLNSLTDKSFLTNPQFGE